MNNFQNTSVADFEKLPTLICDVKWFVDDKWVECTNPARWAGEGHDEVDCANGDVNNLGAMVICESCFHLALKYKYGECGHELFQNPRLL